MKKKISMAVMMHARSLFTGGILFLGILVLLGGCSLAPKYIRPKAPIPDKWPQGKSYNSNHTKKGILQAENKTSKRSRSSKDNVIMNWQNFFTDKNLKKIIEISLKNNRDLRLATLSMERTRAMYGIKRTALYPGVNISGRGIRQHLPANVSSTEKSTTTGQYSVNLGISSWEIDFFGRIRSLKQQALQEFLATDQARRSVQISLISQIGRTYLTLAADREDLKLIKSTLDTEKNIYDLILYQYRAGLANKLDLRRAQTQVDVAKGDLARYTQMTARDQNALDFLAGTTLPADLLPKNLDSISHFKKNPPGISSSVLLNRPDIMAAEHRLKGAYAFIGAARAAFFPNIALTTGAGSASDELSSLFKSGSGTWNFSTGITMPVFDPRIWEALKVSKTDRKIILTQYEKTIQTAFREVADALAVRGTIDDRISAQQSLTNALAETYDLAKERYAKGIDSYLGVLDAQRSLYAAKKELIALCFAKSANQVKLYAVLGGGGK